MMLTNVIALRNYEPAVVGYADELLHQLEKHASSAINVTPWFIYFTGDTLFQLAFGKSYGLLRSGSSHWFLDAALKVSEYMAFAGPIPWIFPFTQNFSTLFPQTARSRQWFSDQMREQKEKGPDETSVTYWLLNPAEPITSNPTLNEKYQLADSRLLIIAGVDTTATALTFAMFYLCLHSEYQAILRQELSEHGLDKTFAVTALQPCKTLNAFIDETLRLHPPIPSGLYRTSPPEGLTIGDRHIPGSVTIVMPTYTIQRCKPSMSTSYLLKDQLDTDSAYQHRKPSLNQILLSQSAGPRRQDLSSIRRHLCPSARGLTRALVGNLRIWS